MEVLYIITLALSGILLCFAGTALGPLNWIREH